MKLKTEGFTDTAKRSRLNGIIKKFRLYGGISDSINRIAAYRRNDYEIH